MILATFIGRVEAIENGERFVTLWHKEADNRYEAELSDHILPDIQEGDEFQLLVETHDCHTGVRAEKLEPKPITPEELESARSWAKTIAKGWGLDRTTPLV